MIDWTLFNEVDWVSVVVLVLSVLLSLWRGFAAEAISLAGWVAAFLIANMFVGYMATLLEPWIMNATGRYVVAYAALFVMTLVTATLLRKLGGQVIKATGLTLLDRLLGTVFGLTRGIIIVLVAIYLLRQLAPPQNLAWLGHSQLMPHVDMLANWAQAVFSNVSSSPVLEVVN
ncbi:MAG: membrane protein required for colicin V production [Bacteroidia bacterium]|jgi:membrane protein required for colicin V production